MYSTLVTTTDDAKLPRSEALSQFSWEQLKSLLHRLDAPGRNDFALLLAEPVSARGRTDWYVAGGDQPLRLDALEPAARDAVIRQLQAMRERVRALADEYEHSTSPIDRNHAAALRAAIQVENEAQHVYALHGRPLLVAWGCAPAGGQLQSAAIIGQGRLAPDESGGEAAAVSEAAPAPAPRVVMQPPPAAAPVELRPAMAGASPAPAAAALRWPLHLPWQIPLWLLFLLLLFLIYRLLLSACGVALGPSGEPVVGLCRLVRTDALAAEIARRAALEEQVRAEEAELARRVADCGSPGGNPGQGTLTQVERQRESENIDRRVEQQGGGRGKLNVSLKWDTKDDLDLWVKCPDGVFIRHDNLQHCGGRLDVDRNHPAEAAVLDPVENVTWAEPPPPGEYEVVVKFHRSETADARPVPFIVRVRIGDREEVISGVARTVGPPQPVYRFKI
jgi:hypothetical protein